MQLKYIAGAALISAVPLVFEYENNTTPEADQQLIGQAVAMPDQPGDGLLGRYYRSDFTSSYKERLDANLDFYWDVNEQPMNGVPAQNFGVRWSGFIKAPATESYDLLMDVDDGVRMWINGKLVMDEWRGQMPTRFTTTVDLEQDQFYAIEIEYFQANFDATARLSWRVNGGGERVIPTENLYSELPVDTEDFFTQKDPEAYQGRKVIALEGTEVEGEHTGSGLQAEYYIGRNFDRSKGTRQDETVDFYWDEDEAPMRGMKGQNYSARWEGFVQAPESGHYRFSMWVDDGFRLNMGGQEVVKSWESQLPNAYGNWVYLEKGQFYPIDIDYYQHDNDATARLKWSYEGHREATVPMSALFPELPEAQPTVEEEEETTEEEPLATEETTEDQANTLTNAEEDEEEGLADLFEEESTMLSAEEEAEQRQRALAAQGEQEGRPGLSASEGMDKRNSFLEVEMNAEARPETTASLYPNPSIDGQFTLQLETESATVNIYVFDLKGQRIRTTLNIPAAPGQMNMPIDLQGLPSGTYIIRVQTDDSIWDTKAVVN